jgi:hypothetical protein
MPVIMLNQIMGMMKPKKKVVDENVWMMTCSRCGQEKPIDRSEIMKKEVLCQSCRQAKR